MIGALELFLWRAGETIPLRQIALRHGANGLPAAYLPRLMDEAFARLHFFRIAQERPRILAIGSSRIMRFRKEMFLEDARFYCACLSISKIGRAHV